MYVSIFLVRVVVSELRRRGVREDALLAEAGISAEELADPTRTLALDRYEVFVRVARRHAGSDASAGLHVGESWPTSGYLAGHVFANAASVREALQLALKYRRLVHEGTCFRLEERGDVAEVVYENCTNDADNARFEAEAMLVFLLRMGQLLTGFHSRPERVSFAHSRPADTREYLRLFGVEPVFGAPHNSIRFSRMLLDVPNLHRDPALSVLLERCADLALADQDSDARWLSRVRDLMRTGDASAQAGVDRIASRMGTSARALQRRLREFGTSISQLADDVRRARACDAIVDGNIPIKEIADTLGFSEPSAFHRAFKRWTGTTPQAYRAEHVRGSIVV